MDPTPADLKSLGLPPIDQIGFVVRSIEDARKRYEPMFGPWTQFDGSVREANFRGRSADVQLDILIGHSGELEIEFIECRSGESPHSEFIDAGREGMHHLRYRVEDIDGWIEKVATVGYRTIWYKRLSAEIAFAYMERPDDPLLIEFLQLP